MHIYCRTDEQLSCITNRYDGSDVNKPFGVAMHWERTNVDRIMNQNFTYKSNPRVTDIHPLVTTAK